MNKILLTIALLVLLPASVLAKPQTFVGEFTHNCMTVSGYQQGIADLDTDGDLSVCEGLAGFRVYTEAGEFVYGMPETGVRTWEFVYNAPNWSTQCFKMTAYMVNPTDPNDVAESAFSNSGACAPVRPKPFQPENLQ